MKEYKTERVIPEAEKDTIFFLSTFGWKLYNKQEVYNESDRIVGAKVTGPSQGFFGSFMDGLKGHSSNEARLHVKTKREVTNYVALSFYRDTEIPNHRELVALEGEARAKTAYLHKRKKPIKRTMIFGFFVLVIILGLSKGESLIEGIEDLLGLAGVLLFGLYTVFGWINYFGKAKRYEARLRGIYKRATQLVQNKNKNKK